MRISDWSSDVCSSDLYSRQPAKLAEDSNQIHLPRTVAQVSNVQALRVLHICGGWLALCSICRRRRWLLGFCTLLHGTFATMLSRPTIPKLVAAYVGVLAGRLCYHRNRLEAVAPDTKFKLLPPLINNRQYI